VFDRCVAYFWNDTMTITAVSVCLSVSAVGQITQKL